MAASSEHPEQKMVNSSNRFDADICQSRMESALATCVAEIMGAWKESVAVLSVNMAKLSEENDKSKRELQEILRRLRILENDESNGQSPKMLKNVSQDSSYLESLTVEQEPGRESVEIESLTEAAIAERTNILADPNELLVEPEYRLIGTTRNDEFREPREQVDPSRLIVVHLERLRVKGQELIVFLRKCPNLKVLRLIHLNFVEEIKEKVELNHLEEFQLYRDSKSGRCQAFIDTLLRTIVGLASQILFTKKGLTTGNLFDLKAKIDLEFQGTKTRSFLFDSGHGKLVSSLECTSAILEKYMESDLRDMKLIKLALGSCYIYFGNESVKRAMRSVKELSFFRVCVVNNSESESVEIAYDTVLETLIHLQRFQYTRVKILHDYSMELSQISVLPLSVKLLETDQSSPMNWSYMSSRTLAQVILTCEQFPVDTTNSLESVMPVLRLVVKCCRSVHRGKTCRTHDLLHLLLVSKTCSSKTKWIWFKDFQIDDVPWLQMSKVQTDVEKFLKSKLNIWSTCTDFILKRQSSDDWVAHQNTEQEIKDLTEKYLLPWQKFID